MQSQQEEFVITKFKRHGHPLTRKALQRTVNWLKESSTNSIQTLLKKLNQLALDSNNSEQNLQHAMEILSLNRKGLNSYEDLLEETRKKCIYATSPYQNSPETWFTERPKPQLFQFRPEEKLKISQHQFKRINDSNKEVGRGSMLGIVYQNYALLTAQGKQKILMQNEVNQVELNFSQDCFSNCLLVPGCSYIAHGHQDANDLTFKVDRFSLPNTPLQQKQTLLKQKFKQMCLNISAGKETVGYQPYDFVKYDCVFTPPPQHLRPSLIFGNVTINSKSIERIERLVRAYPHGVSCIILMLSSNDHESIDLSVWLKSKVYLIPHITSDGPRLLPKLPLLKSRIPGAKILTNPARISLQGREIVLANYPLIKNIYSQSLVAKNAQLITQDQITSKVTELLFSQGTISMGSDYYWAQTDYFHIHSETILVVTDSVAAMSFNKSKGKIGGLANTGNFERDGDFLCLMSWGKSIVQFCDQLRQ